MYLWLHPHVWQRLALLEPGRCSHSSSTLSAPYQGPRFAENHPALPTTLHCLSTYPNSNLSPHTVCTSTGVHSLSPEAWVTEPETRHSRQEAGVPRPTAPSPAQQRGVCGNSGPCAETEPIYAGENIFVLRVKGSHFQQFHALFAGPVLGWQREACSSRQSHI